VPGFTNEWQHRLADFVRALDPTRPINQARGHEGTALDVYGFNSEAEKIGAFEAYHKRYPERVLLATENPHSRQTRGVYFTISQRPDASPTGDKHAVPSLSETELFPEKRNGYSSSFDNYYFAIGVRDQHRLQNRKHPYVIGSCRWVGFDYLGEANDKWPFRSKDKGVFDLAGLAKDHYYLYQSIWTTAPMVHLLPHWTRPGMEGVTVPVVAYTNCHSVELFLDGESLGEKVMPEDLQIVWQVPYRAGVLRAVAKNENGMPMAETTRKTAGAPAAVDVRLTKSFFRPNRQDASIVEVTIVDDKGEMIPDAEDLVTFEIEGPGRLIGVENGDVLDLAPTKFVNTRKVFKGKCVGVVQATDGVGEIKITVKSGNLKAGTARIISCAA
jgi:beta-galactosidase